MSELDHQTSGKTTVTFRLPTHLADEVKEVVLEGKLAGVRRQRQPSEKVPDSMQSFFHKAVEEKLARIRESLSSHNLTRTPPAHP